MKLKKLKLEKDSSGKVDQKETIANKFFLIVSIGAVIIVLSLIWSFFLSPSAPLHINLPQVVKPLKSTDNRVNVLLLGLAGGNHDGAYLTDSIIVASYNLKTKKAVLFSIPRDLWLDNIKQKINAAYEMKMSEDEGLKFAEDKIDDILGIPIH